MGKNGLPTVSIVIPARNEGENLVDTVRYVLQNSHYAPLEVIIVDDGCAEVSSEQIYKLPGGDQVRIVTGNKQGVAQARNRGAAAAQGDILVFLDGHCYVPTGWLEPLVTALGLEGAGLVGPSFTNIRNPYMIACGVTWGGPDLRNVWLPCPESVTITPFHIGACQAMTADIFEEVGGYDPGMASWGSEDIEICLRLWLFGYQIYAQPASLVYHLFRTSRPYQVDTARILYNHLRMILLHFDKEQLEQVIKPMLAWPDFENILVQAFCDDTIPRRQAFFNRRRRNFAWFREQFDVVI